MNVGKKVVTTTEEVDGIETDAPEKLEDDVIRALTELDGADEVRWQVHRVSASNPGFCEPELSTAELSLHRIATSHGPGRYRVKGIKQDGTYFKSARITIAEPLKSFIPISAPTQPDSLMLAQMQQTTAIVTAALARPEPPRSEIPWAAIVASLPLMLTAMKDLFKNTSADDAMEKLVKQLALVEKLRGADKETGSNWTDIIRDGLQTLPSLLAGRVPQTAPANTSVHVRAVSIGGATLALETPEAVEPTVEMLGETWLRQRLIDLCQNAQQNKSAELRADLFMDDLPSYIPEAIVLQILQDEKWFEKLSAFEPMVVSYSGWFEEFRDSLLDTLQPDGEQADAK